MNFVKDTRAVRIIHLYKRRQFVWRGKFYFSAVNIFSCCCIFFFVDYTSIFCSHTYLLFFLPNITHIAQSCSALFFFLHTIIQFDVLGHKFKIKYNRKLLFVLHAAVSNFSDKLYCGLMMQFFDPAIVHI